jgi:hypothetical protein
LHYRYTIWGLTAYLLDRFIVDVVGKCSKTGSFAGLVHPDIVEEVPDDDHADVVAAGGVKKQ